MSDQRIIPIVMPKWGLSMEEGRVNEWLVEEGAEIAVGDEILEVETDKIAGSVEAADAGRLRRRVAVPGEVYPVKALLGVLAEADVSDADIDAFVAEQAAAAAAEAQEEAPPLYHFIEVGGQRLRYAQRGSEGEPLLLLHGFGGDLDNWLFNIDALAEHHRVYALDLPGHGQSTKQVDDASMAAFAALVAGFMDAMGIERAHLAGHSMGGAVAMQLAADAPARVDRLALIASAGLGPEIDADYLTGFVDARSRRELKPQVAKLFADASLVTRQMLDDLLKYKRLDGVAEALATLCATLFAGGRQQTLPGRSLDTDAFPTLVVWGEADRIIPAQHARVLGPGTDVLLIAAAGHMVQMEAASKVNAALLEHLAGRASTPA